MIIKYLREKKSSEKGKGKPVGVIVALSKYKIGFSLCNKKDKWDKEFGVASAKYNAKYKKLDTCIENLLATNSNGPTQKHKLLMRTIDYVKELTQRYNFNK